MKQRSGMKVVMKPLRAFPSPKHGECRSLIVVAPDERSAAAVKRKYNNVKYVRHGQFTQKSRPERASASRTLKDLYTADDIQIRRMLIADNICQDKAGIKCPRCRTGVLGTFQEFKGRGLVNRCNKKGCQQYIALEDGHLIFKKGSGPNSTPLQQQAAMLMMAVHGATQSLTHTLTGANHKTLGDRLAQ